MEQITTKHYAELVAKARAHDVYLAAIETGRFQMRRLESDIDQGVHEWLGVHLDRAEGYLDGYRAALRDLSEAILDEDAKLDSRPAK